MEKKKRTTRKKKQDTSEELPMVPLRDVVVFPHMIIPFVVGRTASVEAIEEAIEGAKRIFLATQLDATVDNPAQDQIYELGVVASIVQNLKLPNGNVKVLVEGVERARVTEWKGGEDSHTVKVELIREPTPATGLEEEAQRLVQLFEQYVKLNPNLPYESMVSTVHIEDPSKLADVVAAHCQIPIEKKQSILETLDTAERLAAVAEVLEIESDKLQVDRRVSSRVKRQMEKAQREYYLSEKMKAIQSELGRKDDRINEFEDFQKKIKTVGMTREAEEKALAELKRLEAMPPVSAEATVSRNYLEWLIAVPWQKKSRENRDIDKAEAILNEDHHGLEKVKERILEFLAVRRLVKKQRGSILCFVGPPGVGKTSLAKSIARAMGRKFVRMSLGGVRDEAEIRGHRRTYIGAFPGQILQLMKKAGTANPVFLLDEIEKMSSDFRGDPSSALLEVLDPEQNDSFVDHYLDTEFDLSNVMFIATGNALHTIPAALRDRMEVIRLSGYTMSEKLAIAQRFLVDKQRKHHGLTEKNLQFADEGIRALIDGYTREAGVRSLEREVASVCRKVARQVVRDGAETSVLVDPEQVTKLLGVVKYRRSRAEEKSEVGVATGLAWTEVGGELLAVEISLLRGRGKLTLTGKLGEVMRESAKTAISYARKHLKDSSVDADFHRRYDIHVHIPEGGIPKDGPSAGITIAAALISCLLKVPVRKDLAMTGEITLRGRVLPIGGLKEKLLAAYRAGIKDVVIPAENEKDLEEVPAEVIESLTVHCVDTMAEVLALVFEPEDAEHPAVAVPPASLAGDDLSTNVEMQ